MENHTHRIQSCVIASPLRARGPNRARQGEGAAGGTAPHALQALPSAEANDEDKVAGGRAQETASGPLSHRLPEGHGHSCTTRRIFRQTGEEVRKEDGLPLGCFGT